MSWGKKEKMKTEQVSILEAAQILGVSYSAAVQAARRYGWTKISAGQGPNGGRPRIMYLRPEVEAYGSNRNRQTFKSKKVDENLLREVEKAARNKKPIGRIAKELGVSHFLIGSAAYELVSKGKR
jgi:transposase